MKHLITAFLACICGTSYAAEVKMTEEFIHALERKSSGNLQPHEFLSKLAEIAEKDDPSAQFLIGMTYLKSNPRIATSYLDKSSAAGCAGAETALGILEMLNKNYSAGIAHFKTAASHGETSAQMALSGLYERGDHGIPASLPKAYAWLEIADRQTFSTGARTAIANGKEKLTVKMSALERSAAQIETEVISKMAPRVEYEFCGQYQIDNSLLTNLPKYLRFP